MNRLVRFGPFLNEELWIGADDTRAHTCGSLIRRKEGSVGVAVAGNVCVARVEATRSMGERVSYRIYWFSE